MTDSCTLANGLMTGEWWMGRWWSDTGWVVGGEWCMVNAWFKVSRRKTDRWQMDGEWIVNGGCRIENAQIVLWTLNWVSITQLHTVRLNESPLHCPPPWCHSCNSLSGRPLFSAWLSLLTFLPSALQNWGKFRNRFLIQPLHSRSKTLFCLLLFIYT